MRANASQDKLSDARHRASVEEMNSLSADYVGVLLALKIFVTPVLSHLDSIN